MTRFSCLFGDVFSKFLFVETAGCPCVILSENPRAGIKVWILHFLDLSKFHANHVFHRSHFYSEFLANIKNWDQDIYPVFKTEQV